MARILIGTVPVVGHINPFLPLVRDLVGRGHEVRWYTGAKYRALVETVGATYIPMSAARDYDDADMNGSFPGRSQLSGVAQLKFDMKHIFINNGIGQLRDLQAINQTFHADMLLVDGAFVGGGLFRELTDVPLAVINPLPMGLLSRDIAPFGLGLPPAAPPLNRLRNRTLQWAVEHLLFADVMRYWRASRAEAGLTDIRWLLDWAACADLYLQPSIPGFEYPRSDLAPTVHFIGMLPTGRPENWQTPEWWDDLKAGRPVVHVTQGTLANVTPALIAPALKGLADEDILVVVSTGGRAPEQLGLVDLPANARVSSFLSYPDLLPHTSVMLTNGGYGGTQMALSYGIPVVVAGTTEDKPEVGARVAWSGAGLNLKTDVPRPEQVRDAVRTVLHDGRYRARAQALQAEYHRYDPVAYGVELVEQLARTGLPVVRKDGAMVTTTDIHLSLSQF